MGRDNFERGELWPVVKYMDTLTAELIEMLFGIWTWVSPGNHVLDGGEHWRHLVNTTEPSVCGGDAACCQITFTTCLDRHRASTSSC